MHSAARSINIHPARDHCTEITQRRHPTASLALFVATLLWLSQSVANRLNGVACVTETPAFKSMTEGAVHVPVAKSRFLELAVKVADETHEQIAGFQHICPETIESKAILFRFDTDVTTGPHMRNVHAPLDIAFIDAKGIVIDIKRMDPYVGSVFSLPLPSYQPQLPFRYALETGSGRLERLGIKVGTRLLITEQGVGAE